ncbi:hypothetical protein N657DRAFT_685138 [Parathielavia appendiculata]|uniref:Protein kinase domain-containing protein n=1 Tax=Parathielavia appendiculata TaxID=2587402 RepID=A0AAN6TQ36_9PEZI|nr:hypothetical protein N657DRAFT_685138 [Parathielavia appendiculata]
MAPIDGVAYGLLFQDPGHDSLFVRRLSSGQSCATQLVHSYTTDGLLVRKTLRHSDRAVGGTDRAVQEFDRDIRMARLVLDCAAAVGHPLRVPRLLSASSTPGGGIVSHWDFCNGGTLRAFLDRCAQGPAVLPPGLALHLVLQILETLDFMYTGMKSSGLVYHRDLHSRNIMLHFPSGSPIPDVYLIDFGRAVQVRSGTGPEDDPFTWWDIGCVLGIIRQDLAALTRPRTHRSTGHMARHFNKKRPSDSKHDKHPLRAAYHMLDDLHHAFANNIEAAIKDQGRRRREAKKSRLPIPPEPVAMPPPPSLKPVLSFLRRAVKKHFPRHPGAPDAAFNDEFRELVLIPARERAEAVNGMLPRLCHGVGNLLRTPENDEVKGPWDVAEIDGSDPGFAIVNVLPGLVGAYSRLSTLDVHVEDEDSDEDSEEENQIW